MRTTPSTATGRSTSGGSRALFGGWRSRGTSSSARWLACEYLKRMFVCGLCADDNGCVSPEGPNRECDESDDVVRFFLTDVGVL